MQGTTTHISIQLRDAGVRPKYLGGERVEIGKGVHDLAICGIFPVAERAEKFSTKCFLHVRVTGEFDKGPLYKAGKVLQN